MDALTVEIADYRKPGWNGLTASRATVALGLSAVADTERRT